MELMKHTSLSVFNNKKSQSMSEIKKKKYKCTGCGEDRPCYLEINREPHTLDYMQVYDLKCVLDETNHTGCNWREVECGEDAPVVSNQRELLSAFMRWQESKDIGQFDDKEATIDQYLKSVK